MDSIDEQIARIANDRTSGASAIFESVLNLFEAALTQGLDIPPVARAVVRAQPTMAPVWRAALEALATVDEPARFAQFARRARRAPASLTRIAVEALTTGHDAALHLVTLSNSGAVRRALVSLARRVPVRVSCAEGRPALEGRRLAEDLAATGIPVTLYSDGAIGTAVATATAIVIGADAITPDRCFNKVGTGMLAAAALLQGIPVYVLATRDKFIEALVADRLLVRHGAASEIWPDPPPGVDIRNAYFEATALDLVSAVITDAGVIGSPDVPDVCRATLDEATRAALALLDDGATAESGKQEA